MHLVCFVYRFCVWKWLRTSVTPPPDLCQQKKLLMYSSSWCICKPNLQMCSKTHHRGAACPHGALCRRRTLYMFAHFEQVSYTPGNGIYTFNGIFLICLRNKLVVVYTLHMFRCPQTRYVRTCTYSKLFKAAPPQFTEILGWCMNMPN